MPESFNEKLLASFCCCFWRAMLEVFSWLMLSCLRVCNLCERVQRLAAHSHPRIMFCICRVLISNLPAGCRGRGNPLLNLPKKKSPLRFQLTLCKGNRNTNRGEAFAYLSRCMYSLSLSIHETRIRDGPSPSRQDGGQAGAKAASHGPCHLSHEQRKISRAVLHCCPIKACMFFLYLGRASQSG